jgi:hypothetical protein
MNRARVSSAVSKMRSWCMAFMNSGSVTEPSWSASTDTSMSSMRCTRAIALPSCALNVATRSCVALDQPSAAYTTAGRTYPRGAERDVDELERAQRLVGDLPADRVSRALQHDTAHTHSFLPPGLNDLLARLKKKTSSRISSSLTSAANSSYSIRPSWFLCGTG